MNPMFDQMTLDIDIVSIEHAEIHGDLGLTRCTYSLRLVRMMAAIQSMLYLKEKH